MRDLLIVIYNYLLSPILTLLLFLLVAYAVMGWLFTLGVIKSNNQVARQWWGILHQIVEPVLRPVRRFVPSLGQLDLSFFVVFLGLMFLKDGLLPVLINTVPFGDGGCDPRVYECVKRE